MEGNVLKRIVMAIVLSSALALLGACSTGGSDPITTPGTDPLEIELFSAAPTTGPSPLRSTLTASISGGKAPYFYAWDYTNDGSFDDFINGTTSQTVSQFHDYFLQAGDAGGSSSYQAVLRVTDSEGTVITTDPITVVVQGTQGLTIETDPARTFAFTGEQDDEGNYIFRSGQPVFFRSSVVGGSEPYSYEWDFDDDGQVDSTQANPQFTFTNTDPGSRNFVVHLTVTDLAGEQDTHDYIVTIDGPPLPPSPATDFEVLLNTNPQPTNGIITLRFDPTGQDPSLPLQPELELAAAVSSDPTLAGTPPYEFYWDFESDGKLDSQESSPDLPYYDDRTKSLVNPYLHNLDEKSFTLKLIAIDSAGRMQTLLRTIRSIRVTNRPPGVLDVGVTYSSDGSDRPYEEVSGSEDSVTFTFSLDIQGSTGIYQYHVDVNGDGTFDAVIDDDNDPGTPPVADYVNAASGNVSFPITFGRDTDTNADDVDDASTWPVPGYYPVQIQVKSTDVVDGATVDETLIHAPVSLVELNPVSVEGDLELRADHEMLGLYAAADVGGANGQSLQAREVIIAGGVQSSAALREVERITQVFTPPAVQGGRETLTDSVVTDRVAMNEPRRGAAGFTDGTNFYMSGGRNTINGALASTEFQPINDNNGTVGWSVSAEINLPPFYPLYDLVAESGPEILLLGGVFKPNATTSAQVSARTIQFSNNGTPANPVDDGFGDTGFTMITPRYDSASARVGDTLYVIGGRVASGESVSTVEALDIVTGTWTTVAQLQNARAGATADVIDGRIYVYGGADYPANEAQRTLVTTAEVFNPQTGVWSYSVPPTAATYDAATAVLPGPGSVGDPGANNVFFNTIWYMGGEGGVGAETNFLQEFVYFYVINP
jgi:hypothetical protein